MSALPERRAERRAGMRYQVSFPISLTAPDRMELHGQAINASKQGVLLEARGRLRVQVTFKGRDYWGWLVRAYKVEQGVSAYGIELEEDLDLSDE